MTLLNIEKMLIRKREKDGAKKVQGTRGISNGKTVGAERAS